MDGFAYIEIGLRQQLRARWIGATGLVTMRIRAIDQRLIREIQFRRPIYGGATRQLTPLLIYHASGGIAISGNEQFARNIGEMLLVLRPAQTGRELQIAEDVVVNLAEPCIGIQRIGILAQEVIVSLVVEAAERDWDRYTCRRSRPRPPIG